jgi:fermentation-respiration switch protein FrsA (DUF1100 family)
VDDAAEFLSRLELPIKLIHGTQDTIVPLERSKKFNQKYSHNTTLDIVDGKSMLHPFIFLIFILFYYSVCMKIEFFVLIVAVIFVVQ